MWHCHRALGRLFRAGWHGLVSTRSGPARVLSTHPPSSLVNEADSPLVQYLEGLDYVPILGPSTVAKFKYLKMLDDARFLALKDLPAPPKLSVDEMTTLGQLRYRAPRMYYLSLVCDPEHAPLDLPAIQELEERIHRGFDFSPEVMRVAGRGCPDWETKAHQIQTAYEDMRQAGDEVPWLIPENKLRNLFQLDSTSRIRSTLQYLSDIETKKLRRRLESFSHAVHREANQAEARQRKWDEADGHLVYALGHNSISMRVLPRTIDQRDEARMIQQFHPNWGHSMVVDLQFLRHAQPRCLKSIFVELQFGVRSLRRLRQAFALYFCNFDPTCEKSQEIFKFFPRINHPTFPVVLTEKSYLDLFPLEELVYLTPDSKTDLTYNPSDIYIVGALTSKGTDMPRTLTIAKKASIRHARLPLRKTLGMAAEVNIDHCMAMLSDYRYSGDWLYASRWMPSRFIRNQIRSGGEVAPQMESLYNAHHALSPSSHETMVAQGPVEYRRRFAELMQSDLNRKPTQGGRPFDIKTLGKSADHRTSRAPRLQSKSKSAPKPSLRDLYS